MIVFGTILFTFYLAPSASVLWQLVTITMVSAFIMVYVATGVFFQKKHIELTAQMPQQTIYWHDGVYALSEKSRYSFIGFWLALTPVNLARQKSLAKENAQYLFIPRFQLSNYEISFLCCLINAGQSNTTND